MVMKNALHRIGFRSAFKRHVSGKLCVSLLLATTACNGGAMPIDSQDFLGSLDGPKVGTVADAMMNTATQAELNGNFRGAAQVYEQLLEKKPHNVEIMQSLADSLRRDGQSQRAIAVYDAIIFKDENNADAKEGKALALIALGDYDTPAALFEEVMKIDSTRWKTLNALGILFTTRNMQPEAQQYFNEALKNHPGSPSIMNNLGLSQALELNFDGAVETLSRASSMTLPSSSERRRIDLNTALVHASSGNIDQAQLIAEQHLTGAALNNNLGLYAHLAKDDRLARAFLNKALSDSKIHYSKAWENLEDITETALAQSPDAKKPAEKSAKKKEANTPVKKASSEKKEAPAAEKASAPASSEAPAPAPTAQTAPAAAAAPAAAPLPAETSAAPSISASENSVALAPARMQITAPALSPAAGPTTEPAVTLPVTTQQ